MPKNKNFASVFSKNKRLNLAATLLLSLMLSANAAAQSPIIPPGLERIDARVSIHSETGKVRFIGTSLNRLIELPPGIAPPQSAEAAARAFSREYGTLFGIDNPAQELHLTRERAISGGREKTQFQQTYQGVPVIAGELIVNLGPGRKLLAMSGEISPELSLSTNQAISAVEAREIALEAVAKWYGITSLNLTTNNPVKSIYDPSLLKPSNFPPILVWQLEVKAEAVNEYILIDAQTGVISLHFSQIHNIKDRQTYDAGGGAALPGTLVCDETDPTCIAGTPSPDAQNAHNYASDTYDFYASIHGRDGIDDAGGTIISTVNWSDGVTCPNAFWNSVQMVYCLGFADSDDVVGHELTHGVTENESNLLYYYQSGAINESFSDVWGEFVDLTNGAGSDTAADRWLMGEDIPVFGALRDMQDPTVFGDPDRMTSSNYFTGSADSGGVHANSGVNNKAVYLMTDGDTFNSYTITSLGITKVATIYYEVQANLLTSGSDYLDLYDALYQACLNVMGTAGITNSDCTEVQEATQAVEMDQQPVAGFNPEAALCPVGEIVDTVAFYTDMESATGWSFSTLSGTNAWNYESGYATSGVFSLFASNVSSTSDAAALMTTGTTVPSGGYLHFRHAFGFEAPNWDGGVLEYSSNGGAWTDMDSLFFDGQDYQGTISTSDTNPLAGRNGFVAESQGYVSSRYDLDSLAGSSVQIRFRVGTDSIIAGPLGWAVDDVQIYNCAVPAPDLITINPGVSNTVLSIGQSFTASASVQNQGLVDSASTTLRYFQSADSTISTADTEIGSDTIPILAASGTSPQSAAVTAPATLGNYWIGACVDAVVGESDASNQCSAAVEITVTAPPDLVTINPGVSDTTLLTGENFTASATVQNQGGADSAITALRYYQSADSTISTDDTEIATDAIPILAASGTSPQSATVTAPATPGTYWIGACVDSVAGESDTNNQCSVAVEITVATPPDLITINPGVSDTTLLTGQNFTASATVQNQGGADSASTTLRYVQSTNNIITPVDEQIATSAIPALSATETSSSSETITAPATPGTYWIGACVDTFVGESDAFNQCSTGMEITVVARPDLVTINPSVSNAIPSIGQSFTATASVQNIGTAGADSTLLHYHQSTDSAISTADTEVVSDAIDSLLAGATSPQSTVSITAPATPGTYWIGACVDAVAGESNAFNQCSIGVEITVPFNDVPTSHWAFDDIQFLADIGVASGCGDGNFCPDQMATRSLVALWLGKAFGLTEVASPGSKYLDVANIDLNAGWIEAFGNAGISEGCNIDGTLFCPDQSVSRASLAILLLRANFGAAYLPTAFDNTFSDVLVGDFGAVFVEDLFTKGITNGCSATEFCPTGQVSIAELAVLLSRTLKIPM